MQPANPNPIYIPCQVMTRRDAAKVLGYEHTAALDAALERHDEPQLVVLKALAETVPDGVASTVVRITKHSVFTRLGLYDLIKDAPEWKGTDVPRSLSIPEMGVLLGGLSESEIRGMLIRYKVELRAHNTSTFVQRDEFAQKLLGQPKLILWPDLPTVEAPKEITMAQLAQRLDAQDKRIATILELLTDRGILPS